MPASRLSELSIRLKTELERHVQNKGYTSELLSVRFILEEDVAKVLAPDKLRPLLLATFRTGLARTIGVSGASILKVDNYLSYELGASAGQHKYLLTLGIILYACGTEALVTFRRWLESDGRTPNIPCSCCSLPLSRERAIQTFGENDGSAFYRQQNVFRPLVIQTGANDCLHLTETDSQRPLPFLTSPVLIGGGSAGTVFGVCIARRHFQSQDIEGLPPHSNEGNFVLAVKVFRGRGYTASAQHSAAERFTFEHQNLINLRNRPNKNENVMLYVRSITQQGSDMPKQMLFFPLATCNLDDFLRERSPKWHTNSNDVFARGPMYPQEIADLTLHQKAEIMFEAAALVGGLVSLHETSLRHSPIYHCDIKPHNILLYSTGSKQDGSVRSRFRWMLTDFDQAAAAPMTDSGAALSENYPSVIPQARGIFQAPETYGEIRRADASSDVWSMGCVLFCVLCFLQGRKSGFESLMNQLRIWCLIGIPPQVMGGEPRFFLKLSDPMEQWDGAGGSRQPSQPDNPHPQDLQAATSLMLHPAIRDRLDLLRSTVASDAADGHDETTGEGEVLHELGTYLYENVFVIGREDRQRKFLKTGKLQDQVTRAWKRLSDLAATVSMNQQSVYTSINTTTVPTASLSDSIDCSDYCKAVKSRDFSALKSMGEADSLYDPNKICPRCRLSPLWKIIDDNSDPDRDKALKILLQSPKINAVQRGYTYGSTPIVHMCRRQDIAGISLIVASGKVAWDDEIKEEYNRPASASVRHALNPLRTTRYWRAASTG